MKNKKYTVRILSALICAILLTGVFLGVCSSAEEPRGGNYDLSRAGSSHNKVLSSADVLERILGEELSSAERAYLVSYGDLSVSYDDGITTEKISAMYKDERLTVNAFEYSYESVTGSSVVWIPKSAELCGISKSLSKEGNAYVAVVCR